MVRMAAAYTHYGIVRSDDQLHYHELFYPHKAEHAAQYPPVDAFPLYCWQACSVPALAGWWCYRGEMADSLLQLQAALRQQQRSAQAAIPEGDLCLSVFGLHAAASLLVRGPVVKRLPDQ